MNRIFTTINSSPAFCLLLFMFALPFAQAQPTNDECSGAIVIPVGTSCNLAEYTNVGATYSSEFPLPSCGGYQGADVWFKVTVPPTGCMVIEAETQSVTMVLAAYTGTCGALIPFDCTHEGASGGTTRLVVNDPAMANVMLYIRTFRYFSVAEGDFEICAFQQNRPANDDCSAALPLSNPQGIYSFAEYDSEFALPSTEGGVPSCGFYKGTDVWFTTEVPVSGKLVINMVEKEVAPVIVLYTGDDCDDLEEYTCAYNNGDTEIILNDDDLAGETIYLRVFGNDDDFGGTFEALILEPTQDYCSEARYIQPNNETETYVPYTNKYATKSTNGGDPDCGYYKDKDIWFVMDVPSNGELVIDSRAWEGFMVKPVFTIYTGDCSSLTEYDCDYFSSENEFGAKITINDPALADQNIYLRMYNYDSPVGGAFDLALYNPAVLPVDLVAFTARVDGDNVLLEWATASEENNDYFLVEHSVDGRHFMAVGHVSGKGTTEELQQYKYMHLQPRFGDNYYRLKQVDYDGAYEYSNIVHTIIHLEDAQVELFPNPAFANGTISLQWAEDYRQEPLELTVVDALGRIVYRQQIDRNNATATTIDCGAANFDAGVYFLQLRTQQQVVGRQRFTIAAQ